MLLLQILRESYLLEEFTQTDPIPSDGETEVSAHLNICEEKALSSVDPTGVRMPQNITILARTGILIYLLTSDSWLRKHKP